jgi:hypothetical protein
VEGQATILIAAAAEADVLSAVDVELVFATGVLGYSATDAARNFGLDREAVYRTLRRARLA